MNVNELVFDIFECKRSNSIFKKTFQTRCKPNVQVSNVNNIETTKYILLPKIVGPQYAEFQGLKSSILLF